MSLKYQQTTKTFSFFQFFERQEVQLWAFLQTKIADFPSFLINLI